MTRIRLPLLAMLWLAGTGCSMDGRAAPPVAAAATVDSIRPIEEELARFRASVGARREVRALHGGAGSRDSLVARFGAALAARDTAALAGMLLDSREFAWLYYPYTVYTHAPYRQVPGMVWLLTTQNSAKGLRRLLERYGGQTLEPGVQCAPPEPQDLNRLHPECLVRFAGEGETRRLFGTILERDGRFKFVSYANEL